MKQKKKDAASNLQATSQTDKKRPGRPKKGTEHYTARFKADIRATEQENQWHAERKALKLPPANLLEDYITQFYLKPFDQRRENQPFAQAVLNCVENERAVCYKAAVDAFKELDEEYKKLPEAFHFDTMARWIVVFFALVQVSVTYRTLCSLVECCSKLGVSMFSVQSQLLRIKKASLIHPECKYFQLMLELAYRLSDNLTANKMRLGKNGTKVDFLEFTGLLETGQKYRGQTLAAEGEEGEMLNDVYAE